MPRAPLWIGVTTLGYGLGTAASGWLVGATLRPLSPLLAGIPYILVYGALIGGVMGVAQMLLLPAAARRRWLVATVIGASLGFALLAVVGEILANTIDYRIRVSVSEGIIQTVSGALLGLAIGIAQRRALPELLPSGRWWIAPTAIGAGLGYVSAAAILELFEIAILRSSLVLSFGVIVGLFIAVAQGLALRVGRARTT